MNRHRKRHKKRHKQKKKKNKAPYDKMVLSTNGGVETKVLSFACFQPSKTLMSCLDVCPSLLEWAEYLLTPAMETRDQEKDRQQKLGEKPMKSYTMTHTKIKLRPQ